MKVVKAAVAIVLCLVPLVGKPLAVSMYPEEALVVFSFIMRIKFNPFAAAWRRFQQRRSFDRMRAPWEKPTGLTAFYERN